MYLYHTYTIHFSEHISQEISVHYETSNYHQMKLLVLSYITIFAISLISWVGFLIVKKKKKSWF